MLCIDVLGPDQDGLEVNPTEFESITKRSSSTIRTFKYTNTRWMGTKGGIRFSMTKRRNVMLGLGALAFGSGATFVSGAFDGQVTSPTAELQVLADARLTVRAPDTIPAGDPDGFSGATNAVKKSPLDDFTDTEFDRENLPTAQIHDTDVNSDFIIRAGVTTGEDVSFDGIMEIINEDGEPHDVGISYGDYDGGQDGTESDPDGYGSDVNTSEWDDSSELDPKDVQDIYQFRVPDDSDYLPPAASSSEKLLSPSPGDDGTGSTPRDRYNETVTIGDGEAAIVVLDYNTSGKTGVINQAAAGGNPFQGSTWVSLLEQIWVEVDP